MRQAIHQSQPRAVALDLKQQSPIGPSPLSMTKSIGMQRSKQGQSTCNAHPQKPPPSRQGFPFANCTFKHGVKVAQEPQPNSFESSLSITRYGGDNRLSSPAQRSRPTNVQNDQLRVQRLAQKIPPIPSPTPSGQTQTQPLKAQHFSVRPTHHSDFNWVAWRREVPMHRGRFSMGCPRNQNWGRIPLAIAHATELRSTGGTFVLRWRPPLFAPITPPPRPPV